MSCACSQVELASRRNYGMLAGWAEDTAEEVARETIKRLQPDIDKLTYDKLQEVKAMIPQYVDIAVNDAIGKFLNYLPTLTDQALAQFLARKEMIIDEILADAVPKVEAVVKYQLESGPARQEIDNITSDVTTAALIGGATVVLATSALTYWLVDRKPFAKYGF